MRKREMYQLWCPSCGKLFLKDHRRYFLRRKGWRNFFYCSRECWKIGVMPEHLPPTPYQPEAARKELIAQFVNRLTRRRV